MDFVDDFRRAARERLLRNIPIAVTKLSDPNWVPSMNEYELSVAAFLITTGKTYKPDEGHAAIRDIDKWINNERSRRRQLQKARQAEATSAAIASVALASAINGRKS